MPGYLDGRTKVFHFRLARCLFLIQCISGIAEAADPSRAFSSELLF